MDSRSLRELARLYGISESYVDVEGAQQSSTDAALLRTLQLLGAPIAGISDVPEAMRSRRQELWGRMLEPAAVAWDGQETTVCIRLPAKIDDKPYSWQIVFEDGQTTAAAGQVSELPLRRSRQIEGVDYVSRMLALPEMPIGYHRLTLDVAERNAECLLISAPMCAYGGEPGATARLWGVFLPLYALYRESNRGAGDFTDLESLMRWTAEQGGSMVATLPLLASLWELNSDPSPYSPATRLFFNEFYLDPSKAAELPKSPAAQASLEAAAEQLAPAKGRGPRYVDYPEQMRLKRNALEKLAETFYTSDTDERRNLERYVEENPDFEMFARFRAAGERQGNVWLTWPSPLREGLLTPDDYDETVYRYHLYVQWQVEKQLARMKDDADGMKLLWYLDFPLGVNAAGYDVWRNQELFVREASGGAPPDTFFTKGQDWGFPPLHPLTLREQGYGYFIDALRAHLRRARVLRFDHVMSLYRIYWVPHGFSANDGAYVRYPMDELMAILTLESHRHKARIVGENLGTVPPAVNDAMAQHGVDDMYVLQYETNPENGPTLRPVEPTAVASLNTHDMPQFAAYWQGLDIADRVDLGLLTDEQAQAEELRRGELRERIVAFLRKEGLLTEPEPHVLDVLEACEAFLAASDARLVLVNLEDLWGESLPQNVPGTYLERPNWRRQAKYPFETFQEMDAVRTVLQRVDRLRESGGASVR